MGISVNTVKGADESRSVKALSVDSLRNFSANAWAWMSKAGSFDPENTSDSRSVRELSEEELKNVVKRAADLVSALDIRLKYEVIEDAGVVQIQVVNVRDGQVVRKVPADEVVKLIARFKEQLSDRTADHVNVWA
jgi:flagellar protein FlaG